jgi:DNA-binding protein HU-beta
MNKRDLAKAVAVHSDVDLSTVSKVLDGFTDVVTAVVSKGEAVMMTGFAKFAKVERAARMGRNPATGEQIRIKASKRARIAPAKTFKDAVLSPAGAPKLARGVWPLDVEAVKRAGQSDAVTSPVKTAAVKKAAVKKAAVKKAAVKKAAVKKAAVKKAAVKKAAVKKAAVKTAAVKKAAVKKAAVKKAAVKA